MPLLFEAVARRKREAERERGKRPHKKKEAKAKFERNCGGGHSEEFVEMRVNSAGGHRGTFVPFERSGRL